MRKCRYCKKRFPEEQLQVLIPQVCKSKDCLQKYFEEYKSRVIQQGRKKLKQKERAETQKIKESLKTHGQWLQDLQKVFNEYIRQRDAREPCISCGEFADRYDAGHYWSVSGYSGVRFDEMNVHKQCVFCNHHLSGNLAEYTPRLIEKIGQAEFDALKSRRQQELKLTIPEIKEQIKIYRQRIKDL